MKWHSAPALLCCGVLALPLGACATVQPVATPPVATPSTAPSAPTPAVSVTASTSPSASPVATAVSVTASRGTAHLAISVLTTVVGFDDEIQGNGVAVFDSGAADISWDSVVGPTREIVTGDQLFVQLEPPSGAWLEIPADEWTPTAGAGRPLQGLDSLMGVRATGEELLDGVATTRYTGSLPLTGNTAGLGLNEQALRLVAADPSARLEITVWVDQQGLIVRVMRTLVSTTDVSASNVTRLDDFGLAAAVSAPS